MGTSEIAIDIGTGDGAFVVRRARAEPTRLWVGIDANRENLAEVSRKAARRPERGGLPNALFVHASAEALPPELAALAQGITILLPWGSLLRAVAGPDPAVLAGIRALCRPGARLEVVMGTELSPERWLGEVLPRYRAAGFEATVAPIARDDLRRLGTTWASRLAFGRPRPMWRLTAQAR